MTVRGEPVAVNELPIATSFEGVYSIASEGITADSHGMFKYPCKFIPHVPRWALKKYYLDPGCQHGILDPFAGSGTTLVESVLMGIPSFAIEMDPLGRLLTQVKTTALPGSKLRALTDSRKLFEDLLETTISIGELRPFIPVIPRMQLWFTSGAARGLATIKLGIAKFHDANPDEDLQRFLQVCLASIVRRVSNADDQSPKPYVSRKIIKEPAPVKDSFLRAFDRNLTAITEFSTRAKGAPARTVGYDARQIDTGKFPGGNISLAITSPPYINAFDYVRSLKLENFWLDFISPEEISEHKKKHVGTEAIPANEYNGYPRETDWPSMNERVGKIYERDKKRAHVVQKFFMDMALNLEEVRDALEPGGHYCIVVGDGRIRGVTVPTHSILIDIGRGLGFTLVDLFAYVIKNRYLRFPRQGRGGLIKRDWVIVLRK